MPRAHELHKRNQMFTPGPRYIQWGPKQSTGRLFYIRFTPNFGVFLPLGKTRAFHWCTNKSCTRARIERI